MKFLKESTAKPLLMAICYLLSLIIVVVSMIFIYDKPSIDSVETDVDNMKTVETGTDFIETSIESNNEKLKVIKTAIVTSEKVRVIETPGTDKESEGKLLGILVENDEVNIVSVTEFGYYQIEYQDGYAYVFGPHLEEINILDISETTDTDIEDETEEPYKDLEYLPESKPSIESTDVLGDIEVTFDELYKTIEIIAPDLVSITGALLENYEKYGIKPSFQLAVFCVESGYGKSDLALYKNNLCGFNAYPTETQTVYEHATTFESKSACTLAFGDLIYNHYISNGRNTIDSISTKYCPPNAYEWTNMVRSVQKRIESTYNTLEV